MPDLNLQALGQQALAMANSASESNATPAATPASEPAANQGVAQVSASQNATTPTIQTQNPDIAGQAGQAALIEVDFGGGRVEKLTQQQIAQKLVELEAGSLRQADYTKKTTEAARLKQEAEKAIQTATQMRDQYNAIVNHPQFQTVAQQLQQMQQGVSYPQSQQPQYQPNPNFDPTQPMTMGQAQQMAQVIGQQLQELRAAKGNANITQADIEKVAQQIVDDKLQIANYGESINATLSEIYKDHPVLKVEPEFEDILRYRVAQLQPETPEAALKAFRTIAAEMANNLSTSFSARQQQQAAVRATLAATGTEPPGGNAVPPQQQTFKTTSGKLDWSKLKQAAVGVASGRQ